MSTRQKINFLRVLLASWILALTMISGLATAKEDFPNRNIAIVVAYSPGGAVDLPIRIISDELSKNFGVPVVVVNKPGGGGIIGAEYVAHAKADGYTMLASDSANFVFTPVIEGNLPYKRSDFTPIARFGVAPGLIAVRKEAPWKTIEELIAYAKKSPVRLKCGSSGVGGLGHFALEILKVEAGVDITHVPFKGGAPCITACLGGHVDMMVGLLSSGPDKYKESGPFRVLGISTGKRASALPEAPTLAEKGYPISLTGFWVGLHVPKGVEKSVLEKISRMVEKTFKAPQVIEKIEALGYQSSYMAGEEFAQDIEREFKLATDITKKAKLILK